MEIDSLLQELADDRAEYAREGGTVVFMRQGEERTLEIVERPGVGTAVLSEDNPDVAVPLVTWVQRDLLDLPRLAKQIQRTLDKAAATRPARFIEGPAEITTKTSLVQWRQAKTSLISNLNESEPGTTRLVQLMAPAGQGKTFLLEQAALEASLAYQPDQFPTPLLLPVDLLGRYVGTVDDAIAGSLNNTYFFPGLTQRDVALAVRNRWLILALDGFDELVSRVGARDAFLRISELLDQLKGAGTLLVSARESFFELYQISAAIRTYLQPKVGSYSTSVVKLLPWGTEQGKAVFASLGSSKPDEDLGALVRAFEGETDIVLHPFFLTRLAPLWRQGERFAGVSNISGRQERTRYVIETFVQRESQEKWIDRDRRTLLDSNGHNALLGGIAGEMWRSGAFALHADELRLAAELSLSNRSVPHHTMSEVLEKVPQHAALQSRDRGYGFIHESFLHYFLGHHIASLISTSEGEQLSAILSGRELTPSITEWIIWNWRGTRTGVVKAVNYLEGLRGLRPSSTLADNVAVLTSALAKDRLEADALILSRHTFSGDFFAGGSYVNVRFVECRFWITDLRGATFSNCVFQHCEFSNVQVGNGTRFDNSVARSTTFTQLEREHGPSCFSPDEIGAALTELGLGIAPEEVARPQPKPFLQVESDVVETVERLVKQSERSTDLSVDDLEERFGSVVGEVVKIGLRDGVLREVVKNASGPRKLFVRVKVDRNLLLQAYTRHTGVAAIDAFWASLARKYPARR